MQHRIVAKCPGWHPLHRPFLQSRVSDQAIHLHKEDDLGVVILEMDPLLDLMQLCIS